MLEKNKDYVEFTLQYTSVDWARDKDHPEVCFNGYSNFDFPGVPIMDVVCKDFSHKVVVVSKRDFEQLQTENEELKKKLEEFSPVPGYREFLTEIYPEGDVEKLVWATEQIFSKDRWKFWKDNYEALDKLVGFSSVEEIQDYLTNEAECDTLQEAISKLHDQVKYTCDEWYSANSRNNSWKAAAECNSPKELIEKLNLLRDDISGHDTVIESYERNIKKWQKFTGCDTPEEAGCKINDLCDEICKRKGDYDHLLELTGYKTEQDIRVLLNDSEQFVYKDIRELINSLKRKAKFTESNWQKVTGFSIPEKCSSYIDRLEKKLEDIKNLTEED